MPFTPIASSSTTGALFPNAENTEIYNSQLVSAHTINHNYAKPTSNDPYEILQQHTITSAFFDSEERFDPPQCHPETRTAILDHLKRWAMSEDSKPIMWIRGGAGAGKSAIAQTLSEFWDEEGSLSATFYFSRTAAGRNEKKYVVSTLACGISASIPESRSYIQDAIRREPTIFKRTLKMQVKKLMINPLTAIADSSIRARIVVIDGLDECCIDHPDQDHEQQQKEILEAISYASSSSAFPLRFLIASRPERQIRELFEHGSLKPQSSVIALGNSKESTADIKLYLRCKLDKIREVHPDLDSSWPPEHVISWLVHQSSGHFVYIVTVVRYLSSPRVDPVATLKSLNCGSSHHHAELDELYTHILQSVEANSLPTVMNIFAVLQGFVYGKSFFDDAIEMSPTFIARFLCIPLRELYLHLIDLHSILDIPPANKALHYQISFLHASFDEYLLNPSRSGRFYLDYNNGYFQHLSFSLRHLFIQVLSSDDGQSKNYTKVGFVNETASLLLRTHKTDERIVEALAALINRDDDEFARYVRRVGLDCYGTTRRSLNVIKELYSRSTISGKPILIHFLMNYPETHGGFVPLDPYSLWPKLYPADILEDLKEKLRCVQGGDRPGRGKIGHP